jgi:hypothetical protein
MASMVGSMGTLERGWWFHETSLAHIYHLDVFALGFWDGLRFELGMGLHRGVPNMLRLFGWCLGHISLLCGTGVFFYN